MISSVNNEAAKMAQPLSGAKSHPSSVGCGDYAEKKDCSKGKCPAVKAPRTNNTPHSVVFRTPVETTKKTKNTVITSGSARNNTKLKLYKSSSCESLTPKPTETPKRRRPLQVPYRVPQAESAMAQPSAVPEDREQKAAKVITRALLLYAWRRRRQESSSLAGRITALQAEANNLRRQKSVLKSLVASETSRMAQVSQALTRAEESLAREQRTAELLRNEKTQLQEEVASLRCRLEETTTHVNNLKNTVLATQAEAQMLESALTREREKLLTLRAERQELSQQVQSAEELSSYRAEALIEMEERFKDAKLSAEGSASQITLLEEEKCSLEEELRQLQEDNSRLHEEVTRLENEKEELARLEREREKQLLQKSDADKEGSTCGAVVQVGDQLSWARSLVQALRRAPLTVLQCLALALVVPGQAIFSRRRSLADPTINYRTFH
ncbi:trichohyalin [Schistocerca gregaria]|uniref:trichohyalin n=1 Tax=Schistocerca gregaria TaxID=7010 RepID=UPI00211E0014|nr:trichohyalin [Schistocerca gregaria]